VRVLTTSIDGLVAIELQPHADQRGFFVETFRASWCQAIGIDPELDFVQDNHSRSARGVVRGLHFQVGAGVAKLVRCARGRILDVGVDLRRGSPTFGRWEGLELSDENMLALYLPVGFAHGFCALSETADVIYRQTSYYDPELERAIAWDDPEIGIDWSLPDGELSVSERDAGAPALSEIADELPFQWHP
jgi:dTDP-4-dehydrorhamnose 3,5-epimerase